MIYVNDNKMRYHVAVIINLYTRHATWPLTHSLFLLCRRTIILPLMPLGGVWLQNQASVSLLL
jgi:hypothetical protein